jgi:hypothetical protein
MKSTVFVLINKHSNVNIVDQCVCDDGDDGDDVLMMLIMCCC